MTRRNSAGFTLIETMISMGVLSILSMLVFTAVQGALASSRFVSVESRVQKNIRETLPDIVREIELAGTTTVVTGVPGVTAIRVLNNGAAVAANAPGNMVVFQIPTDSTGVNWGRPIQYRFVNEDTNLNGYLDAGEDTVNAGNPASQGNGDGILTRWIVREQDNNNDGDFNDAGERRVIGGVNELQIAQFTLDATGRILTISLRSTQNFESTARTAMVVPPTGGAAVSTKVGQSVSAAAATRVYILN